MFMASPLFANNNNEDKLVVPKYKGVLEVLLKEVSSFLTRNAHPRPNSRRIFALMIFILLDNISTRYSTNNIQVTTIISQ